MRRVALTTVDNPYDPFDDFTNWLLYDKQCHYNCCEILDRLSFTSNQMTDAEVNEELERAIDDFVAVDPFDIYKKAVKES